MQKRKNASMVRDSVESKEHSILVSWAKMQNLPTMHSQLKI